MHIDVTSPQGKRQELTFEEEDGVVVIEARDWHTGDTLFECEFAGTLDDLRAKVAR